MGCLERSTREVDTQTDSVSIFPGFWIQSEILTDLQILQW